MCLKIKEMPKCPNSPNSKVSFSGIDLIYSWSKCTCIRKKIYSHALELTPPQKKKKEWRCCTFMNLSLTIVNGNFATM